MYSAAGVSVDAFRPNYQYSHGRSPGLTGLMNSS